MTLFKAFLLNLINNNCLHLLEKEISKRLIQRLETTLIKPRVILLLENEQASSVTKKLLKKKYPHAKIIIQKINEKILLDHSVDLIISNLALFQIKNIEFLFQETYRLVSPKGLLIFSTLGPDTLEEIQKDSQMLTNCIDLHVLGDFLLQAGWFAPVMEMEKITFTYSKESKLNYDLKTLKNLISSSISLQEVKTNSLSFEVIYGHAWKENQISKTEISIPVSTLRKANTEKMVKN